MARQKLFNNKQWIFIGQKYLMGYTITYLSEFLGVSRKTIQRNLISYGFMPERKAILPKLDKNEFIQLGG